MKTFKKLSIALVACLSFTGVLATYNVFSFDSLSELQKDMKRLEDQNTDLRKQAEKIKEVYDALQETINDNSVTWNHKRCLLEFEKKRLDQDYNKNITDSCSNPSVGEGKD